MKITESKVEIWEQPKGIEGIYKQIERAGRICYKSEDHITQDIIRHNKDVTIVKIGYDKWNATQWAIDCTNLGMPLEEYPQTLGNFNRPTREMERLILSSQILIDNNDITSFCFRNVELKSDWNGNVKPIKDVNKKKIDGVIASLEALGCALINPSTASPLLTTDVSEDE